MTFRSSEEDSVEVVATDSQDTTTISKPSRPWLKPWKPGASGNPGGRPKMDPAIMQTLLAGSAGAAARLVELTRSKDERVALLASQAVLDRVYGKPTQQVDKTVTTTVQSAHLQVLLDLQAKRDQAARFIEGEAMPAKDEG
jgi:hypothetical protein